MILILEDNTDLGFVLGKMFRTAFKEDCYVTSNLQDAILCACTEDIRLILSDIDLGGFSGLEFIRRIRKLMPHTTPPVVAFTALSAGNREFNEAVQLCDEVYEKGAISASEICKILHRLLG